MSLEKNTTAGALTIDRRSFLKTASYAAAASAVGPAAGLQGQPSSRYKTIFVPENAHPALQSAATLLARKIGLSAADIAPYAGPPTARADAIVFALKDVAGVPASVSGPVEQDGYAVLAQDRGLVVCGARPRSLLFAAGEPHHWTSRTAGVWVRNPSFNLRFAAHNLGQSVPETAAILGANHFITGMRYSVSLRDQMPEVYAKLDPGYREHLDRGVDEAMAHNAAIVKEFHDIDVTVFAALPYGNDFNIWSPEVYRAFLEVYPSAKGVSEPRSWERATLCPSDPATWKLFDAYVGEMARQAQADGIACNFWDEYGMFCQDPRCQKNGLNQFKNEVYESISHYYGVVHPMGQKLHVRTWASGSSYWFNEDHGPATTDTAIRPWHGYVHAPGYGPFSGSRYEVWSRVIKETPAEIMMQTKVYHGDCQPDPEFSTLLGKCKPHVEIVEYQLAGQTIGRHYFPTSRVNHIAATMKRSFALVGPEGGVWVGAGGTKQTDYDVYADILCNCNVYAWRELTWDVNADVDRIWADWSGQIYSPQAGPHLVNALKTSEGVLNRTFSPLGFGTSVNSNFTSSVLLREVLLRKTNRYSLPEYIKLLEPTKENIQLIVEEKRKCLQRLEAMLAELAAAKPYLTRAQADELTTRFDWLHQFAICNVTLDISLWRYRYLRALQAMLTTDPDQITPLAEAFDKVKQQVPLLFRYDPALKFSCYSVPLGKLRTKPGLGTPMPLMQDIYSKALASMEDSVGPDYLPKELIRTWPQRRP